MPENTHPDRLDMASTDMVKHNIDALAALFPNCVTETAEGKAVDFDLLKQELNHQIIEGNKERYRLEWPGKREAIVTANVPTTKTLRPVREDSVDFDNTENLYIEGDNLEVLKLLQESYFGKIKMIYIDPPYNTGNDFVYKDNFTQDSDEFKEESGLVNELNQRLVVNQETSGRYHSDWLTMMYPRLKLARNLLTEDGVIFISIDDHEVHNLRKVCDEIFGEENFIVNVIWQRTFAPKNDAKYFSSEHEQLLIFAKSIKDFSVNLLERGEKQNERYSNSDNDVRGPWISTDLLRMEHRENSVYEIISPTGKVWKPVPGTSWRHPKNEFDELNANGEIVFGSDGNAKPRRKRFLKDVKQGVVPQTIWKHTEVGHTQSAKQNLNKLFNNLSLFDYPKPVEYISRMITLASSNSGSDLILDFFSGSGTTAHAVMQLNSSDRGNRKFIMVQVPEITDEKSEAFKAGYTNICEIGKERIRKAGKKIKEEIQNKKSGKLNFEAEDTKDLDIGFRVYRVDESNMQDVYYRPQDYDQAQLDIFADNIKPDRTADDLLAQVMLDWGLPLSYKIEPLTVAGKQVFQVAQNSLIACFDNNIDEAFAKEIAAYTPMRIVFRDKGFKDDTAKENVRQLLKQLSPDTEMRVI